MLTLTVKGSWTQFTEPLRDLVDFNTHGSLKGRKGPAQSYGQLPDWFRPSAARADYVVYSYATPIAWCEPGMVHWITPNVRYSVTTTRHQRRILLAIIHLPLAAIDTALRPVND
jgi:hypothetical protein